MSPLLPMRSPIDGGSAPAFPPEATQNDPSTIITTTLPAPPISTALISDSVASSLAPTSAPLAMYPDIPAPAGPIPYSDAWTDSLMEHILDAKSRAAAAGKQAPLQPGMPLTPVPLSTSPTSSLYPSTEQQSNAGSAPGSALLPSPSMSVALPLPPIHPRRTYPLPITHPHAAHLPLLTQPNGSIHGGPPSHKPGDLHAYAADLVDQHGFAHRSTMAKYLKREMGKQVEELERRMKARKSAKDANARTARAIRDLDKERAAEVRVAERWRAEMQRKRGRVSRGPRG